MALTVEALEVLLRLKSTIGDELKKETDKVKGSFSEMGAKFDMFMGKYGGMITGITAVSGSLLALENAAKSTNMTIARTSLIMGQNEEAIRALVLANPNLKSSSEATAQAMFELSRAGITNTDVLLEQSRAITKLAKAIDMPAGQLAGTLVPAMRAANVPMDELSKNTDRLFYIFEHGGDVSEFSNFLQRSGVDAEQAGLSFTDLTDIYGKFVEKGVPGRKAVQLIGDAIEQVNKQAEEGVKANKEYAEGMALLAKETEKAEKITRDYLKAMDKINAEEKEAAETLENDYNEAMKDQADRIREAQDRVNEYSRAINEAKDNTEEVAEAQADLEKALQDVADAEATAKELTDDYTKSMQDLADSSAKSASELTENFSDSVISMGTSLDDTGESIAKYKDILLQAGLTEEQVATLTGSYTAALETVNREKERATEITAEYQKAMAAAAGDSAKQAQLTKDYKAAMQVQQSVILAAIETADQAKDKIVADYKTMEDEKVASLQAQINAEEANLAALKEQYKNAEGVEKDKINALIDAKEEEIRILEKKANLPSNETSAMEDYMEALGRQNDLTQKIKKTTEEYNTSLQTLIDESIQTAKDKTDDYNKALDDQNKNITDTKSAAADAVKALADIVDTTDEVIKATSEYDKAVAELNEVQQESVKIQDDYRKDLNKMYDEMSQKRDELTEKYKEDSAEEEEAIEKVKSKLQELTDVLSQPKKTVRDILGVDPITQEELNKAADTVDRIASRITDLTPATGMLEEGMKRVGVAGGPALTAMDGILTAVTIIGGGTVIAGFGKTIAGFLGIGGAAAGAGEEVAGLGGAAAGLGEAGAIGAGAMMGALTAGIGVGLAGVWALVKTGTLDTVSKAGRILEEKFPTIFAALKIPAAPLALLGSTAIDIVTGQFDKIPTHWDQIWDQTVKAGDKIITKIGSFGSSIIQAVKSGIEGGKDLVVSAFENTLAIPQTLLFSLTATGTTIISGITKGIEGGRNLLATTYSGVLAVGSTLISSFSGTGKAIIDYIVLGIEGTGSALYNAMVEALGPIGDLLPHSPAKTGPLSKPVNWDGYVVDPFAVALMRFNKYKSDFIASLGEIYWTTDDLLKKVNTAASAIAALKTEKKQYYDEEGNYIEPAKEPGEYNPAGFVDMGGYANDFNVGDLSRKANSAWETGTETWDAVLKAWRITYTNGVIRWFADLADDAQAIKEDLGSNIPERWKEAIEARDLQNGGLTPATVSGDISPEAGYQIETIAGVKEETIKQTVATATSNDLLAKIVELLGLIKDKDALAGLNVILNDSTTWKAESPPITGMGLRDALLKQGVIL